MKLAFIENSTVVKYPINVNDLRRKFPNVSFPKQLKGADLSEFGVVNVVVPPEPTYNPETQYLRQDDVPTLHSNGVYMLSWQVINYTDEELANKVASVVTGVRNQRNQLLRDSDWTATTDSVLTDQEKQQWVTYRQALRDVPAQSGFPDNVVWPDKPTSN